jgi:protease-4
LKRRLALRALAILGVLGLSASACDGRNGLGSKKGESLTGPALVELNLSKGISEKGSETLFGPMPGTSFTDLVSAVEDLDPDDTKGVFVRLGTARVGLGTAQEVGELLKSVRDKNIPVYCHADDISNGSMLLVAQGCTEVWLSPAGSVDTVGIAFQLIFGRSLLDKLKVGVDFLQIGKYKGAQEPYTRDEPSAEARETMEGTLRDLRTAWIDGVVAGRGKPVEAALEDGPHTASAAKTLGLIDVIGYADDAKDKAKDAVGAKRTLVAFGGKGGAEGGGVSELLRALSGSDPTADPHVAVVRAVGPITMGGGGGLLDGGGGITETGLGKELTSLTEDDAVKAVVLRIDSPGGSALASDLLWHRLMKLREKKPLIISIGGMAASGGYYLSCAGSRVFAEPTSIVGSIGVVAGKLALHDPLSEIGVNTVTITATDDPGKKARAAWMSPFDRWDDATRDKVRTSMQDVYDTFIDRIAEGRGLDKDVVAQAAEGRIFGGASAKEKKLVDELGGLRAAIAYARIEAGLGEDGKVRVHGGGGGLLEALAGDEDQARALESRAASKVDPWAKLTESLPPEARDWLVATSPLAQGELTVATLPFILVAR